MRFYVVLVRERTCNNGDSGKKYSEDATTVGINDAKRIRLKRNIKKEKNRNI